MGKSPFFVLCWSHGGLELYFYFLLKSGYESKLECNEAGSHHHDLSLPSSFRIYYTSGNDETEAYSTPFPFQQINSDSEPNWWASDTKIKMKLILY